MGNRPLHRTIWEDRKAVFGHLMSNPLENHAEETGKWLVSQPRIRPSHVPWITYSDTDILQACGTLVLCCPIPIGDFSIYQSRIWTRNHLLFKTFGWHGHLLAIFPHGTLEQSNFPPIHQSLQQAPTPARNPTYMPQPPQTPTPSTRNFPNSYNHL